MAISMQVLELLLQERSQRPFSGRLLTLGRQTSMITRNYFKQRTNGELAHGLIASLVGRLIPTATSGALMPDTEVFKALGFSSVQATDASKYQGADIIFDLNSPEVPANLIGACDVILDVGVLEHVYDLPTAFRNIHHMLTVGGRFIIFTTCIHWIDRTFYAMSPTLFADYFGANGYDVNAIKLYRFLPKKYHRELAEKVIDYVPGSMDRAGVGIDGRLWDVFAVVTRRADSTTTVRPGQRYYTKAWKNWAKGA